MLSQPAQQANAGNKWKKALGIGISVGVGVAIINKLEKDKRKKKNRKLRRTSRKSGLSRAQTKKAQSALNAHGFNVGTPDGLAGKRTRKAIREFQRSLGNIPTGALSKAQYATLLGATTAAQGSLTQNVNYSSGNSPANNQCTHRISDERYENVVQQFNKMMSEDNLSAYEDDYVPTYSIDKCGYVTKASRKGTPKRGHIRDFYVDVNESWHRTSYLGFLDLNGTASSLDSSFNGVPYEFHNLFNKQSRDGNGSHEWILYILKETRRLYELAGYSGVKNGVFKKRLLDDHLKTYDGRPDLADGLRAIGNAMAAGQKYASSPETAGNYICNIKCGCSTFCSGKTPTVSITINNASSLNDAYTQSDSLSREWCQNIDSKYGGVGILSGSNKGCDRVY